MLKYSLAVLIATAVPAAAASTILSPHEVRFEEETFLCGAVEQAGKIRRFIRSTPRAESIPEFEPQAGDPLRDSWLITYRIICETGHRAPNQTAHAGQKRL
jgi:hypothetical protein